MSLTAISPIDGRYASQLSGLSAYFSEHALLRYRAQIEVRYLIALAQAGVTRSLAKGEAEELFKIADLSEKDTAEIKRIEQRTAHDVKALEQFLGHRFEKTSLKDLIPFLHFALTSEDVNNLAYGVATTEFLKTQYLPTVRKLQAALRAFALAHAELPMLGRTHGQPASPTTVGKEFAVYVARLHGLFPLPQLTGKLNGAVGNFNAHAVAHPEVNWLQFSERFVESLGLQPLLISTQVLPADAQAALFHATMRVNTVLLDLVRDVWLYLSHGTLTLTVQAEEVGSSTMPHKVNPILFENAEGNLHLANALFHTLATHLPTSRRQRDLVGSTLQRNIGVAFAHALLAIQNCTAGMERLAPDMAMLSQELDAHPEVLAEAIQTALRAAGDAKAYDTLKQLTRGKEVTLEQLRTFIAQAKLPAAVKERLQQLSPAQYVGLAAQLCRKACEDAEIR